MAAVISPLGPTLGQYPTTTAHYQVAQAPVQQRQQPQTHLAQVQRQGPEQQQVVIHQQAHPPYQQQQVVQQQQQQQQQQQVVQQQPAVAQTRIVHASPRLGALQDGPTTPIRQFVTFKNLPKLNRPDHQWENCEHITIALDPTELEKMVRFHDIPNKGVVSILTGMGIYRNRHVRKYEDKLNRAETDPSNWTWVLQALGEKRKHRKTTPHTFWAIFQRNARRPRANHEPVQIVETTPVRIAVPVVPALPPPQQMLVLPAPAQPQPQPHPQPQLQIQTQPPQMLAITAPPIQPQQQQQQQQQQAAPHYGQAAVQPGRPVGGPAPTTSYQVGGNGAPRYLYPAQAHQPSVAQGAQQQLQQPQPAYAQHYQSQQSQQQPQQQQPQQQQPQQQQPQQQQPQQQQPQQQQPQKQHYQATQRPVAPTQAPMQNRQLQQPYRPPLAPLAPTAPQASAPRQLTQGPAQPSAFGSAAPKASQQYKRPIPGPINPATGRPASPRLSPTYTRTSDIDLSQFRGQGDSLPRRGGGYSTGYPSPERELGGWSDDDSDYSASGYDSSSGSTGATEYSTRRRPAPLGGARTQGSPNGGGLRGVEGARDPRARHPQATAMTAPINPSMGGGYPGARSHVPAPARPQIQRQKTYDIEVKIGPAQRPPLAPRSTSFGDSVPRSQAPRHPEEYGYGYESSDGAEDRGGGRKRGGRKLQHAYEVAGLVSFGGDVPERRRTSGWQ